MGPDLSRNNFSGVLPSNIGSLVLFLTTLDLFDNQFSCEIPTSLSNITYLNTLMLQKNQLTGPLPPELVSLLRLTKFSVAFNQLTGPVSNFNLKFGRESFFSNEGLCGQPMDPCVDPKEDVIRLEKIGGVIGGALFAPLGVFLDWFVSSGRKKKQEDRRH
ncbi:hypothetical protein N665_0224s0021 [Sinapis alba]|nr:hypothetical protein N665_0224s0021 [Sinapis alba]